MENVVAKPKGEGLIADAPMVMAIINVTPDSFYSSSRTIDNEQLTARIREVLEQGADILDIGGYSTRPGADDVDLEEEWRRVEMGLRAVQSVDSEVVVSVDTFRAEIVERAYALYGKIIINDISGGCEQMYRVAAKYRLPYILMHMRGTPQTMQNFTEYDDILVEVMEYFKSRLKTMQEVGVEDVMLDLGFGFAKSLEQNYQLLASLHKFAELGYPILSGVSRKSMIYKALDKQAEDALTGTIALNWESLNQGASILRVHDVTEAVDVVRLFELYNRFKIK